MIREWHQMMIVSSVRQTLNESTFEKESVSSTLSMIDYFLRLIDLFAFEFL